MESCRLDPGCRTEILQRQRCLLLFHRSPTIGGGLLHIGFGSQCARLLAAAAWGGGVEGDFGRSRAGGLHANAQLRRTQHLLAGLIALNVVRAHQRNGPHCAPKEVIPGRQQFGSQLVSVLAAKLLGPIANPLPFWVDRGRAQAGSSKTLRAMHRPEPAAARVGRAYTARKAG